MILQSFYDLADLMKAKIDERNAMLGTPADAYTVFLQACTLVGAELVTTGTVTKPYSDGSFNTAVDTATTNLGYDPTNLSERQNGLDDIVGALSLPTGVTASQLIDLITEGWASMFTKDSQGNYNVVVAIPSTDIDTTSIESSGIMIPNDADALQLSCSVDDLEAQNTVVFAYAVSADDENYSAYADLGTMSAEGTKIYAIDNLNIPKYIKVKATASGEATVKVSVSVAK